MLSKIKACIGRRKTIYIAVKCLILFPVIQTNFAKIGDILENKETKLRIHNITAKAALKFGREAWVLKKREEQRLEAAQMKFLDIYLE
jgi:hypothetical protein